MTTRSDMALALKWVREIGMCNAPFHVAAIEEAIAAYDPERAGAFSGKLSGREQPGDGCCAMTPTTHEQREDDALADTQRVIIEAAEQRGYERGKAEWRQQVKDAWDNLSIGKVDKPKDTGRFA